MGSRVHDGPLGGTTVPLDLPRFLAADKTLGLAWIYELHADGYRVNTDPDNSLVLPAGMVTGERRLDWNRLDQRPANFPVIAVGGGHEQHAGAPLP